MLKENIDAVIFDFGGVLINIDYRRTIDAFTALGIDNFEALYSQAKQSDLFNQIETGEISSNDFVEGLLHFLPSSIRRTDVVNAWNAMIMDVPYQSIEILQRLHGKYRVFLLSNTNPIHLPYALEAWAQTTPVAFRSCFEKIYLSYEMGMRKPDLEIFNFVCRDSGLTPENTLFIDDSIQHIKGAQECGIQTHLLIDIQSLPLVFS